jgi:hypothetical protein
MVSNLEALYLLIKTAATSLLQRELYLMVNELYDLNEEEIGILEGDKKR